MSVDEASLFLDLFFKKKEQYLAPGNYRFRKGHWYRLSMRLKLAHYNLGDPILDALSDRFYYALIALDEIGIQYFLGPSNDTADTTLYHFNYLITLITGMFDNLALKTDDCLGINFSYKIRISLNNKSGRDFLTEINKRNPSIREHIKSYVEFINLIYSFRELVVHLEGLNGLIADYREWRAFFIKINDDEVKRILNSCGYKASDYDPFTRWGFYEPNKAKWTEPAISELFSTIGTQVGLYESDKEGWIEPYHFSLATIKKLTEFIEKYLVLLGYSSFIEAKKQKNDEFAKTLKRFEQYHLGF